MTPPDARHRFDNRVRYRDPAHPGNAHLTPAYVLAPVIQALDGIGLDPCTEPENPVDAEKFYTTAEDGLVMPWRDSGWSPSVFVNPPYGRAREPWVMRCEQAGISGQRVILLMPSHTDTRIFHRALTTASGLVFVQGRIKFGTLRPNRRQAAASHPSVLIGWNVDLAPCKTLGTLLHCGDTT